MWRVVAAASVVLVLGTCSDDVPDGDAARRQDNGTTTETTTDADRGTTTETTTDADRGTTTETTTDADRGTTTEATTDADRGTIHDTVPPGWKPILEPVALDAVADFGDGVTARLTAFESLEVKAFMPGEISGPGVAITVELTNGSDSAINLDDVAVELVATGDRYATLITTRENTHLTGELASGATAEGTYVFTIADEDRAAVTVQVTYAAPKPTALFQGNVADV